MKPPKGISNLPLKKREFASSLLSSVGAIPGVLSTTLVGSFCSQPGIKGISDIDTIVVVNQLTETIFSTIRKVANSVAQPELLGLPTHELVINTTFGPLKFDTAEKVVLHLMIYDVEGHRKHVLESPFTCYDWERSKVYHGKSLAEIYPVLQLLPIHFSNARRGLEDYLNDISHGSISYRKYQFLDNDNYVERKLLHTLDNRHKGEYAYHIIRNLLLNYAKMIRRENIALNTEQLCSFWYQHLPETAGRINEFMHIADSKSRREAIFPDNAIKLAKEVIQAFSSKLNQDWNLHSNSFFLIRHGPTKLNDGSFLGQRRNPPLLSKPPPLGTDCRSCFSSPLSRAVETARASFPNATIVDDDRLLEIDYGNAEGLMLSDFQSAYPDLVDAWKNQQDPPFPRGESTSNVRDRLLSFLDSLNLTTGPIWAFSHNVVIRVAIGYHLRIPLPKWFRIPVDHLDPIEFKQYQGKYYINLSLEQRAKIADQLVSHDASYTLRYLS